MDDYQERRSSIYRRTEEVHTSTIADTHDKVGRVRRNGIVYNAHNARRRVSLIPRSLSLIDIPRIPSSRVTEMESRRNSLPFISPDNSRLAPTPPVDGVSHRKHYGASVGSVICPEAANTIDDVDDDPLTLDDTNKNQGIDKVQGDKGISCEGLPLHLRRNRTRRGSIAGLITCEDDDSRMLLARQAASLA